MSFLKTQWKKQLPIGIFTGIVFYFVDKCFWLYRQCVGNSLFDKLGVMFLHLELLFYHWYPSLYLTDLLGGFAGAAAAGRKQGYLFFDYSGCDDAGYERFSGIAGNP